MKLLLLVCYLFSVQINAQYKLLNYFEDNNKILFTLELNKSLLCEFNWNSGGRGGYLDESRPGEYALPTKEVFIGIPADLRVISLKAEVLRNNNYSFNLAVNPIVIRINDSTLGYDHNYNRPPEIKNELLIIKGYLWINNIFSVHLSIKQYDFDDINRLINEIVEIEIEMTLDGNIDIICNDLSIDSTKDNSILINEKYCQRFSSRSKCNFIDTSAGWIDYSKDYLKIKTAEDDLYRITYDDLQKLNIMPSQINPLTFNIYNYGQKIPIYVSGEANGLFEPGEYIEFIGKKNMGGDYRLVSNYGEQYNEYTGMYTDTTSYWLTWDDTSPSRVFESAGILPLANDTILFCTSLLHMEENNWFDFSVDDITRKELPFWIENKTWGWTSIGVGIKSFDFFLKNIYPGQNIKLFAKLQSYASGISSDAHHIGIGLNKDPTAYDLSYLNKYQQKILSTSLISDSLINGINNFKIISLNTNSEINSIFFDWFEIEYPTPIILTQDFINIYFNYLETNTLRSIKIYNAESQLSYSIWKYGSSCEKYVSYSLFSNTLVFSDTISPKDRFLVKGESKIKLPYIEPAKRFTNLRDSLRQADYIIITSDLFIKRAEEYLRFIESHYYVKGLVVNVKDIYDEFSFGFFNPEAIKDFLSTAYLKWRTPSPKFVFLIGDGSYDYHYNKHKFQGAPLRKNFVPSYGAPVSDSWFVIDDTTNAFIPKMNIGRLPVTSLTEFDHYFVKHQKYLDKSFDDWNKTFLLFSGGPGNDEQQMEQIKRVHDSIITKIILPAPIGGYYNHYYKTKNPTTNFGPFDNNEIQNSIASSAIIISYLGHSGTQTWDNGIVDPGQLHSTLEVSPLITDFGCSTGKFAEPDIFSFSELFVTNLNGEAIAYISNSSLGFISTSTIFPHIFYKKILLDSIYNISEAHRLAKVEMLQSYGTSGVYKNFALTNILIGDPIICLPLPTKPNLKVSSLNFSNKYPSDDQTSFKLYFEYSNSGLVLSKNFEIRITDISGSEINLDTIILQSMPLYPKELQVTLPIFAKAGNHILNVVLDHHNIIEEIYETDNSVIIDYNVSASAIRLLNDFKFETSVKDTIILLNPSLMNINTQFELDISSNKNFLPFSRMVLSPGLFYTPLDLTDFTGSRKWIRGRIKDNDIYSFESSVNIGENFKYYVNDTIGFNKFDLINITSNGGKLSPDSACTIFNIISAGLLDGKTAVINKNGQNYIPMGNVIGHHVCLFGIDNHQFIGYKKFDVFNGGSEVIRAYYNFLDSLDSSYLLMIAISDEGRITVDSLKNKIREFGSLYIDSLGFRSSWAFIGRRGASIGSMPEAFSTAYNGRVQIDTVFESINKSGSFTTLLLGPAVKWEGVTIQKDEPPGTEIMMRVLGLNSNNSFDTLEYLAPDSILQVLQNTPYNYVKLDGTFTISGDAIPAINLIALNYLSPPELGTNNQEMTFLDTIETGGINTLGYYVFNAGESDADSFYVAVELSDDDNKPIPVSSEFIQKLPARQSILLNASAAVMDKTGNMKFTIRIDTENKIFEKYKDNNSFTIPFYVTADTTAPELKILADGEELMDGDYVSAAPEIRIELYDSSPLPLNNPSAIKLYLDEREVVYTGDSDTLFFQFSNEPKAALTYKPAIPPGIHTLKIFASDASGNYADTVGTIISFIIAANLNLLQVFNYPNPFKDNTYFTFKLTQLPDAVDINIYSVAGRLIKKLRSARENLKLDFNTIFWDGNDEDGCPAANGVYLYKIIVTSGGVRVSATGKMARVR